MAAKRGISYLTASPFLFALRAGALARSLGPTPASPGGGGGGKKTSHRDQFAINARVPISSSFRHWKSDGVIVDYISPLLFFPLSLVLVDVDVV